MQLFGQRLINRLFSVSVHFKREITFRIFNTNISGNVPLRMNQQQTQNCIAKANETVRPLWNVQFHAFVSFLNVHIHFIKFNMKQLACKRKRIQNRNKCLTIQLSWSDLSILQNNNNNKNNASTFARSISGCVCVCVCIQEANHSKQLDFNN